MVSKIVKSLLLVIIPSLAFSQATPREVRYAYKIASCAGVSNATAWIGSDVVLMLQDEKIKDRNAKLMDSVVHAFDRIILKFQEVTGLDKLPNTAEYNGKPVIEIVKDNCGAGGLANHGTMGMSTGTAFFDRVYDRYSFTDEIAIPQVFFYELNRNFWLSGQNGYNTKFDWAMEDTQINNGWWTVGMNNAMAYMMPHMLGIKMQYFGKFGLDFWKDAMLADFTPYLEDKQYDFDNGWRQDRMPWRPVQSINNLMSGFIIYAYENFGGEKFLKGVYEQMNNNSIPNRSSVFAYQECRDNIYKIWSIAAQKDLVSFFEDDMKWVITQEVKDQTADFISKIDAPLSVPGAPNSAIVVFPNPTTNLLTIKTDQPKNKPFKLYNGQGQFIMQSTLNNLRSEIDMSTLDEGLYWLKFENETIKVVKE